MGKLDGGVATEGGAVKIRRGVLFTISRMGSFPWAVDVMRETPKRYQIRTRRKTALPRGWVPRGTLAWVPKSAVTVVGQSGSNADDA